MKKIIITGFSPFGGETMNPSYEAVKELSDTIADMKVIKFEVPTVFRKAAELLEKKIDEIRPDFVLCVGQAGGRSGITLEKVAINLMDAEIADNEDHIPSDEPVSEHGPAAYFTSLPIKKMAERIREKGIPANLSYTAGTFVCNELMYHILHMAAMKYPNMRCGFIHVPYTPKQTIHKPIGTPSMDISLIKEALIAGIEALR